MGYEALVQLLDSFLRLSLVRQCPAVQYRTKRHPVWKSLFFREEGGSFGAFLGGTPLAAQLMEHGSKAQNKTGSSPNLRPVSEVDNKRLRAAY